MSESPPLFTVVLATFGRGRHIAPTVESVLRQTFTGFELLIVGDGCNDETAVVARSYGPKVSWHNLEQNSGSQSAPNNYGISRARGDWIAYIGHDDIWHQTHLSRLAESCRAQTAVDVVVSGCVYHGPPDSDIAYVTGVFTDNDAPSTHFFPPSSVAHRRELAEQIGPWRDPETLAAPVDADLFLRAAASGRRFVSTGRITVHKFAGGHRYLSYLDPQSYEQQACLDDPHAGDAVRIGRIAEAARQQGRFMAMRHIDFSAQERGRLYQNNRSSKGLRRPPLQQLTGPVTMQQTEEPRGLDWHALEPGPPPFRWSGPNPRPKILVPYTCNNEVEITLRIASVGATSLGDIEVAVNGRTLDCVLGRDEQGDFLSVRAMLAELAYTVITLQTPVMFDPPAPDLRSLGVAISDIMLVPLAAR